jgi:hypothetical protein
MSFKVRILAIGGVVEFIRFIRWSVLTRFTPYNTRQVTMRYGASRLVASLWVHNIPNKKNVGYI